MAHDRAEYGHFCMAARALERVGDRWTLLVIRDLMYGPRRFTDLAERLAGITPKTLTLRLRELEADGVIEADREPGRREVWYRLTPSGEQLRPVLEELLIWGLRNAVRAPKPGEAVHPEHLLWTLQLQLERERVSTPPVRWSFVVLDGGSYTLVNEGESWRLLLEAGDASEADVTVRTTRAGLARFLTTPPPLRDPQQAEVELSGTRRAVTAFLKAIEVFPLGRATVRGAPANRMVMGAKHRRAR